MGASRRLLSFKVVVLRKVDLKAAIAVSDVVQNRPRPLRDFDQIHMKTGDLVFQSEIVASWAEDRRLAFIGDGGAISVCVAYLKHCGVLEFGPKKITVFDFDERSVQAVKWFADHQRLDHILDAQLYNCLDPFPDGDNTGDSATGRAGVTWSATRDSHRRIAIQRTYASPVHAAQDRAGQWYSDRP